MVIKGYGRDPLFLYNVSRGVVDNLWSFFNVKEILWKDIFGIIFP